MSEGQEGMIGPETRHAGSNQPEAPFQPSWVLQKEGEFTDSYLKRVAEVLHRTPLSLLTRERLMGVFFKIQDKIIEGGINETEAVILGARITEQIEKLDEVAPSDNLTVAARDLVKAAEKMSMTTSELIEELRRSRQLSPSLPLEELQRMTVGQVAAYSQQQVEQLRNIFGRMDPLAEESRWIDVEYSQEFYTRFTPNMEPHFYTEITSTNERRIWDARWKLARAAFFKKVYSGQAEKLVENQDLIEFTTEDMEMLYEKVPGVRFALEWYVDKIVSGGEIDIVDNGTGKPVVGAKGEPVRRTIWDVKFGSDFEEIRRTMRYYLMMSWGISPQDRDKMNEEKKLALENKLKSADSIAWNWIFCSNLIESIDSRYSFSGCRHGNLAAEICSDDLRAVFHPQEKFEDKCWSGQEWGAFGRWGLQQANRIKEELKIKQRGINEKNVKFIPARKRSEYWKGELDKSTGEIYVYVPECYPPITMKSFWEQYEFKTEDGRMMSYLDGLRKKERILWRKSEVPDAWKINYVTVRMRKAIGLFDHFTRGEGKPGWLARLIDYYTRLNIEKVLKDYYKEKELDRRVAERKAKKHFHNLKVWAVYAVRGGVGRTQDRDVTDPYSTSRIGVVHTWNRLDDEVLLRKPQQGEYLKKGEKLEIVSIE